NPGSRGHSLIGVGVAKYIQPVPGVPHAVLLVGQQSVNHLVVGVRRLVLDERVLLGGRGWNPNEVEVHAPQQRELIGGAGGGPALFSVLGRGEGGGGSGRLWAAG